MRTKSRQKCLALLMALVMLIGIFPLTAFATEHAHTESCYAKAGELLCSLEESDGHSHGEDCYCEGGEYICGLGETEGHIHLAECICSGGELICLSEESEGHTHGENCFAKGGELICGQDDLTFLVSSEAGTTLLDSDYASLAAAFQAIFDSEEKSGTIVITKDHTPEGRIVIPAGVTVTLTDDGSEHTISAPAFIYGYQEKIEEETLNLFTVEDGAKLTINGTLTFAANESNAEGKEAVASNIIDCHGVVVLESGTISGKNRNIRTLSTLHSGLETHKKALVLVCGNNAAFTMNGGKICDAAIDSESGGVKICCGGTFTMNGGTICNLDSTQRATAGAVLVYGNNSSKLGLGTAKFTMNNGIIENNNGYRGAGVHVRGVEYNYRATFTMNGGTIRNNHANGIQYANGTPPQQGGGGGVYVEGNAVFTMSGGTISNNTVYDGQGGGVCLVCGWNDIAGTPGWTIDSYSYYYPAAFTMNGGTISGNRVTISQIASDNGCGGGIYLASNCVSLNAGTIQNNYAERQGGGVYVASVPYVLKLKNAIVKENTASIIGGGLWACPTGEVEISVTNGAAFYDNTADDAADDLASVKDSSQEYKLTLPDRALGGGKMLWYKDGGISAPSASLGMGDGSARYSADSGAASLNPIKNCAESLALKAILSANAKRLAEAEATLIIQGNSSARGGGIGTNGSVTIGDKNYDYALTVNKVWANLENDNQKVPVTVFLKIGETVLDSVILNAQNNWTATFTELPDPDSLELGSSYTVVEEPVPDGFAVTYSDAEIDDDNRTVKIIITNTYTPAEEGSLTIRKEVSGSGTPDPNTAFEFTVTKGGTAAAGKYTIAGGTEQPIPADGKIDLKAGESALLTGLAPGEYTVTETAPTQPNYVGTSFSVNHQTAQTGVTATVSVTSAATASTGGWQMKNGAIAKDDDGYFVYTITKDQIDADGKITVDCDPLAEYMEMAMRAYQNFSPYTFKVKFVNETGTAIQYQDYNFDTVNWIPAGETYIPSADPSMLNTNDGADKNSAGYGWGEAWQKLYPMLSDQRLASTTLNAEGFDGNHVRLVMAPLRCINPAIISYFKSNPGYGTLSGSSSISSAASITLLQMNAFPELIKQAFTFEDYQGNEISLAADSSRTYADFICAFYGVSSLDQLTVAQKYNVLGTGSAGSPGVAKNGQANVSTYYSNFSGNLGNRCIPYSALNDGTLDYFKTWGMSGERIAAGKEQIYGSGVFSDEDAAAYAYQPNFYLLESDPEIIKMAYEYLYDRCMRITFDNGNRAISTAWDDSATPAEDVSSIKSFLDKTDAARANVLAAMNQGDKIADQETITLDNMKGYIEVPNAWSVFRYYDFGFELIFQADTVPEEVQAAAVVFTNRYQSNDVPTPEPGNGTGNLKVSKTVSGNDADQTKGFTFTVTLSDSSVSGAYGDMTFENGVAVFTLKDGESKTARSLPAGITYTVEESDNAGYTVTVNGGSQATATGTIVADTTAKAAFNNHKSSGGGNTPVADPATVIIKAKKTLDGNAAVGSDYSFVLKDESGKVIQTVQNHNGDITFASLSFAQTGTYIYTLSEVVGLDHTVLYDITVYKIIIEVTKSGDYHAVVSYEKDGTVYNGIPVFSNRTTPTDETGKTVDVSVKKVWNDGAGVSRPASVSVQLYRNGDAYGSPFILNEDNNWSYTWLRLDSSAAWTVDEVSIPDGYSKTVTHSGNHWTITNTLDAPPDTPDTPDTPDMPDTPDTPDTPNTPDKPSEQPPQTGDNSKIELWIALACVSMVSLLILVLSKKRLSIRK